MLVVYFHPEDTPLPVTFVYDICGNLTETHSPWFDQKVYFTSKPYAGMGGYGYGDNRVSYVGNVNCADEGTVGPAANVAGYAKVSRNYAYSYDAFDRLTAAEEVNDSRAEVNGYDRNGNITSMLRLYEGDAVQDAAIVYDGNRLSATLTYPFGGELTELHATDLYRFGGKELDTRGGLFHYDFSARHYDPVFPAFTSVDPMAEDNVHLSPYSYCHGNPVMFIDPTGESTQVIQKKDGSYMVKSVNIHDSDLGVYVVGTEDEEPRLIGYTATITSFYDTDPGKGPAIGATIDPNDKSGITFLEGIAEKELSLVEYMNDAKKEGPLDFKYSNGDGSKIEKNDYRGMPISSVNGLPVFASARDVGNIAAGYVAATNGLTWKAARFGFDTYQNISTGGKMKVEGVSTQNAQALGFSIGKTVGNGNFLRNIPQFAILKKAATYISMK